MGVLLDKTVLGQKWECFRTEIVLGQRWKCFWTKQS